MMRKTQDRLLNLRRAKEGVLRFEAVRFGGGSFRVDGNLTSASFRLGDEQRKAVQDMIDDGILEHEHPGVPHRSGLVKITEYGRTVFGAWTTEKLSVTRRTMLRAATFQGLRQALEGNGSSWAYKDGGYVDGVASNAIAWLESNGYIEVQSGNAHTTDKGHAWLEANDITG